jgi:hypothetical protein
VIWLFLFINVRQHRHIYRTLSFEHFASEFLSPTQNFINSESTTRTDCSMQICELEEKNMEKAFFSVRVMRCGRKSTQDALCASILINYSCAECIMCLSVSFPYFSPLCSVYSARSKQAARDLITSLRGQHRWNFNTRASASLFCLRLERAARVSFCTQGSHNYSPRWAVRARASLFLIFRRGPRVRTRWWNFSFSAPAE